jgi:hypothetical protein
MRDAIREARACERIEAPIGGPRSGTSSRTSGPNPPYSRALREAIMIRNPDFVREADESGGR